jgi:hypothetical protein
MIPDIHRTQTHLKYGAVTGLVVVVFNIIIYRGGLDKYTATQYVSYVPFLAGIIINARVYSRANGGNVTFGNVFGSSFKASLVVTMISLLWIILCLFIFPDMKDKYMTIARASMAKNPNMTDDTLNQSLIWMEKLYMPMMIFFTGLYGVLAGLLFSLIGGGIARKQADPGEA